MPFLPFPLSPTGARLTNGHKFLFRLERFKFTLTALLISSQFHIFLDIVRPNAGRFSYLSSQLGKSQFLRLPPSPARIKFAPPSLPPSSLSLPLPLGLISYDCAIPSPLSIPPFLLPFFLPLSPPPREMGPRPPTTR